MRKSIDFKAYETIDSETFRTLSPLCISIFPAALLLKNAEDHRRLRRWSSVLAGLFVTGMKILAKYYSLPSSAAACCLSWFKREGLLATCSNNCSIFPPIYMLEVSFRAHISPA